MTVKDWITITLSVLAFLMSAVTGYVNVIRQVDHISIVVARTPSLYRNNEQNFALTGDKATIVFINSGNRAATITRLGMSFVQESSAYPEDCNQSDERVVRVNISFEPITLKEREVVTKVVDVGREDLVVVKPTRENKDANIMRVLVCVKVHLATPSIAYHEETVATGRIYINKKTFSAGVHEQSAEPIVLLKKTGNIFF